MTLGLLARETFVSMNHRNFRLFFSGQLVSQVGNWLTLVAQTLLVLKLTDSGVALGLLAVAQFGPLLVLGAYTGLIADRFDKRRLLIVVQALAMVQSFCLAVLGFAGDPPLAAVYAVALFGGFTIALDNPARRSFVVELVPEEDIGNAVSLNSALMTGSRVLGPALAGLLVTTVGFGWCFLLDGLSYLAVLAGLHRMDPSQLRPAPVTTKGKGQVREGLRYVRSVPELFVPLAMLAVVGTLAFNFQTVLPLFAVRDLGGSDITFTLLMSVVSGGAFVGALAQARRRLATIRGVSVAALAFGGSMGLLAVSPSTPTAFFAGSLVGLSSIAFMTSTTTIIQTRAVPTMRGRVLALQGIVFLGSTPVGGPIAGIVADQLGARYSLALGAAGAVVAGTWGLLSLPRRIAPVLVAEPAAPVPDESVVVPRAS